MTGTVTASPDREQVLRNDRPFPFGPMDLYDGGPLVRRAAPC